MSANDPEQPLVCFPKAAGVRHEAVYGVSPFLLGLATSSGASSNG